MMRNGISMNNSTAPVSRWLQHAVTANAALFSSHAMTQPSATKKTHTRSCKSLEHGEQRRWDALRPARLPGSARTSPLRSNDAVRPRQTRTGSGGGVAIAASGVVPCGVTMRCDVGQQPSASPPSPSTRPPPPHLPRPHATSVYRVRSRSHRNAAARGQLHASLRTPLPPTAKGTIFLLLRQPAPLDHTKLHIQRPRRKAEPAVARRLMVKGALTPQPRGRRRRRCRLPLAAHRRPRAPTTSSRPTMTPPPPPL
jgi:hypothetical protein